MTNKIKGIGLDIELGDAKNKNSIGLVDQKMKELRIAMKRWHRAPM